MPCDGVIRCASTQTAGVYCGVNGLSRQRREPEKLRGFRRGGAVALACLGRGLGIHAEAQPSGAEMQAQMTIFRKGVEAVEGGGKPGSRADAERPARSELVGDPADNR